MGRSPQWHLVLVYEVSRGLSSAVHSMECLSGGWVLMLESKCGLRHPSATLIIEGFSADFAAFHRLLANACSLVHL
jgi:hypothetical protein